MILKLNSTDLNILGAHQHMLVLKWLNVIPCKSLRIKLSNIQLRTAIGLRLDSKIGEKHIYVCGNYVTEEEIHDRSCLKSAERFSWHSNLNAFMNQNFASTENPFLLESRHLHGKD